MPWASFRSIDLGIPLGGLNAPEDKLSRRLNGCSSGMTCDINIKVFISQAIASFRTPRMVPHTKFLCVCGVRIKTQPYGFSSYKVAYASWLRTRDLSVRRIAPPSELFASLEWSTFILKQITVALNEASRITQPDICSGNFVTTRDHCISRSTSHRPPHISISAVEYSQTLTNFSNFMTSTSTIHQTLKQPSFAFCLRANTVGKKEGADCILLSGRPADRQFAPYCYLRRQPTEARDPTTLW